MNLEATHPHLIEKQLFRVTAHNSNA